MVSPGRTTSITDVADRAEVSVGTVSNVLNNPDRVSRAIIDRVHAAIAELGYVRNEAARQLRAGSSTTIGVVLLDMRNPFFADLARGAEDRARSEGFTTVFGDTDNEPEREVSHLRYFEQQRAHGVVVSPLDASASRLAALEERRVAIVLVDADGTSAGLSSVSVDDVAGGRMAVEHLIDSGRRKIAFVAPVASGLHQIHERHQGALDAVDAAGDVRLITLDSDGRAVPDGRRVGQRIASMDPDDRPDAVFAANDLLATGILESLVMGSDLSVPDDISLIGYDDIDFSATTIVPLSSIRRPAASMGRVAVEMLLEHAANPTGHRRQVVFQPQLVVRSSSVRAEA